MMSQGISKKNHCIANIAEKQNKDVNLRLKVIIPLRTPTLCYYTKNNKFISKQKYSKVGRLQSISILIQINLFALQQIYFKVYWMVKTDKVCSQTHHLAVKAKGKSRQGIPLQQDVAHVQKKKRRSRKKLQHSLPQINPYFMYESSPIYVLSDFNSIALHNDLFYNLLKMKSKTTLSKRVKCKCAKSKCDARYCDCFSHGQVCSSDCSCINCLNIHQEKHQAKPSAVSFQDEGGCKCQKSECVKNYCECFQRGQCCTLKCKCKNCLNYL